MSQGQRLLAICFVVLGAIMSTGAILATQNGEPEQRMQRAKQLTEQGNWKQAGDIYAKLTLDPAVDGETAARALAGQALCQLQLNQVDQLDAAINAAVTARPNDWQVLQGAAMLLTQTQHQGVVADQKFTRGYSQRNGGVFIQTSEQDRLQALKWLLVAIEKAKQSGLAEDSNKLGQLYLNFADTLILGRTGQLAWQLQASTDLTSTPNYTDLDSPGYAPARFAPANDNAPITYSVPDSFEAATNDGARLRWALSQVKANPESLGAIRRWADFLNSQFSVETLQQDMWFFQRSPAGTGGTEKDQVEGIAAIHTLADDETIAKLSTGIKRFKLAEEFNPIHQYQLLAAVTDINYAEHALSMLFQIFLDRRQYPKAAAMLRQSIDRFGTGVGSFKTEQLNSIIQPRVSFDPVASQVAGKPSEVSLRFRNSKEIEFTAWSVDIEKLFADAKQSYKQLANQQKPNFGGLPDQHPPMLESPGGVFSKPEIDRYVKAQAAKWQQALEPRENHWDRRVQIKTPLVKAGLYLIEGRVNNGAHKARCLMWIQDSVLTRKPGDSKHLFFMSDAETGKPISGANLEFFGYGNELGKDGQYRMAVASLAAKTDSLGLATAALEDKSFFQWITVGRTANGRLALLGMENISHHALTAEFMNELKGYGISDRPLYRPGETVKTKFWVAHTVYGDVKAPRAAAMALTISMRDQQGIVIATKQVTTDRFGACEAAFELPKSIGLGQFHFELTAPLTPYVQSSLTIRVEEYRKPEFEVKVLAPEKPVALGETVEARIQAKYYFGSPVTDADVTVRVQRSTYSDSYYPIGRFDWCYGPGYWWFAEDYTWYPGFSKWRGCWAPHPQWWPRFGQEPAEVVLEQELTLDASGEAKIKIDTAIAKAIYGDEDHKYTISVEVRDSSRRTLTAEGSVIAAREAFKIYSWLDRGYYNVKDKIVANFHARTLDGNAIEASGKLDLLRITYDATGKPTERVVDTFDAKTNAEGLFTQVLEAGSEGQYRLRMQLKDNTGHEVESGYIFTVRGRATDGKGFRYNGLELTTDKREYAAGETVKLLLAADRDDAQVYVFVRPASGAYPIPKLVPLQSKSAVFEIPVTEVDQPNFFVEAFTVYEGEMHQKTREIIVPPANRTLNVKLTADKKEYLPGEEAEIELLVTDPSGKPVSGSCLIAAYDSSLDQIASDVLPMDIREFFWKWRRNHSPQHRSNVDQPTYPLVIDEVPTMSPLGRFGESLADDFDVKSTTTLAMNATRFNRGGRMYGLPMGGGMGGMMGRGMDSKEMMSAAPMSLALSAADASGGSGLNMAKGGAPGGAPGGEPSSPQGPKPTVRKDFADSALWLGNLVTDAQGRAKAKFKMPDNLTTWKISGWAVGAKTEVGSVELKAVTRRNLLVRLQTPRFLVQRDEAVLSAIVNNDFSVDKQVRVKLEIDGQTQLALMPDISEEQVVLVKSHGQTRVDWRTTALAEGNVKLRVSAIADDASDAVEQSLPILVHGFLKTDSFAGTIRGDKDSSQVTINVPAERRVEQSELVVRVSPTLAMAMVDALPYLAEYPYGCTEQTLNRFLPTVLTQRVLLDRKIDLAKLKESRNNLNAQELGDSDARRTRWQRFEINPVYDRAVVDDMVASGVQKLTNMQNGDGGWGWFSGIGEVSYPHATATVIRGLQIAAKNEVAIVPDVITRGVAWLEQYQNNELLKLKNGAIKPKPTEPYKTQPDNTDALVFHVLSLSARVNPEMQQFLYDGRQHLSVYGKSLLAWSTHQAGNVEQTAMLRQNIEQFLVEDAENETAYLRDETSWWYWYGSQIEATAMYLKLLAVQDPKGQVAPRLVKYLLNNRKHATYWNSTRDTALVVEAFSDYLKATGEGTSTVAAEVWLSGKRLGRVDFTPENLFSVNNTIAISGAAVPASEQQLEIRRIGDGPLYWNAYSTNFTMEEEIKPAGLEVKIERRYYSITPTQKDLRLPGKNAAVVDTQRAGFDRLQLKDLAEVPSGQLVEVELLIESKNDYEYLLIEDNKPACLEAVDTQSGYFNSAGLSIYRELRDKKVGLCIRWLPRGKYSVRYQLRSEAPGKFTALPAKIEGMYAPELVGNSADFDIQILEAK